MNLFITAWVMVVAVPIGENFRHIPFATEAACRAAAEDMRAKINPPQYLRLRYVLECYPTGAP